MAQKRSNKSLYEEYDLKPPAQSLLLKKALPEVTSQFFLHTVVGYWWQRYFARYSVLDHDFSDGAAKSLLIARIRARNVLYSTLPELPPAQIAVAETLLGGADVSKLLDIPNFGPSFISLWVDAKAQGLSDSQAAKYIWDWGSYRSPARQSYFERKATKQPLINQQVTRRLASVTAWNRTGDAFIPWDADVSAQHWQVRLNDYPDEFMYALLIDGKTIGDFHDWPQAWNRGESKPEVDRKKVALAGRMTPEVDPATLLSRYEGGAYEAAWRDLVSLGPEVRNKPFEAPARAVAKETMRRAAHNFRLLVKRLKAMNYQFVGAEAVQIPCSVGERNVLRASDRVGLWLPLSLRTFLEEVGQVHLVGSHPVLSPMDAEGKPLLTDPLQVSDYGSIESFLQEWSRTSPQDREPFSWDISPDAEGKADMLMNESVESSYTVHLPNAAADVVLEGESHGFTFVEYLRKSFQWGGFPGWEKYQKRPETELAFLREGLLPL